MGQAKEDVSNGLSPSHGWSLTFLEDAERAVRLRDNKRRHRLRQREYVADLERRLTEAHAGGIQATKEVQDAAKRVVWENSRLRQILEDQGLDCDAIDSLIYKDGPYVADALPRRRANTQPALNHVRYHGSGKLGHVILTCMYDIESTWAARG